MSFMGYGWMDGWTFGDRDGFWWFGMGDFFPILTTYPFCVAVLSYRCDSEVAFVNERRV